MSYRLVALCAALLFPAISTAQEICPDGRCPIVLTSAPVANVVAASPHVRCMINGSCGSGTICGADARGAYVVTNAHVTGTQIGRSVMVDVIMPGSSASGTRVNGRIVMSGYSDSRMVDFAIVFVEGLSSQRYMPMLKVEPQKPPYGTTGSPRCVWPLVVKQFNDPRNYGQGLITGTPNAIGGQSGSAIYNSKKQQIALLTWSINGRCAGQKTSKLWDVARSRNVQLADVRPEGLVELADEQSNRPVCEEGVFGEANAVFGADDQPCCGDVANEVASDEEDGLPYKHVRPVTENLLASMAGSDMEDLPIWVGPGTTPPTDPKPPTKPDCMDVSPEERALIEFIRNQASQTGARERAIDWMKLIPLILQIIQIIAEGRAGA